jgi:hypothetical protein
MPKQSPIPDDLDRPYYEAANQDRLVLQHCSACDRWQFPPHPECGGCDSSAHLAWRENDGDATISTYAVIHDTYFAVLKGELPFNAVVVDLDHAPGINMFTRLPGARVGQVPIGAKVRMTFEATPATGQKIPEWVLADANSTSELQP